MDRDFILFFISGLLFLSVISHGRAEDGPTNKILAIIASRNFRDEEILVPRRIFEGAGYRVVVASSLKGNSRGMLGAEIQADILIDEVNIDDYDAVIFIGGAGAAEYWENPLAHRIAQETLKKDKVLAAICIAPVTLANAGVLSKKKATVWPSEANRLVRKGASYTGSTVETDGNIITANGPSASAEFAEAVLKSLGR